MQIKFQMDFDPIKNFMCYVIDKIETTTLDKNDNPHLKNNLDEMFYIILDTTGILLMTKSLTENKYIIEVNNIRALECSLYIASQTHELDEELINSGDDSYKERYEKELEDTLYRLGMDTWKVDKEWTTDSQDNIVLDLKFDIHEPQLHYCMYKLNDYIENSLTWN